MEKITTEKIPTWAIGYIEYGEEGSYGLTVKEKEDVDNFLSQFNAGVILDYKDPGNPYFSRCPAFGLPSEVVTADIYTF